MTSGIYCIEGDWASQKRPGRDVRPVLDALAAWDGTPFVHHGVGTREELEHRLNGWIRRRTFTVGYVATHGSTRMMHFGGALIGLDDLRCSLAGRAKGRVLLLGGCGVLTASAETLTSFCQDTGMAAVAGYTHKVDFVEAMAFEMLVLRQVVSSVRMKDAYQRIDVLHGEWAKRMGFRMATATWASPSPRRGRPKE